MEESQMAFELFGDRTAFRGRTDERQNPVGLPPVGRVTGFKFLVVGILADLVPRGSPGYPACDEDRVSKGLRQ
jgi:hypothetical protein